MTIVVVGDLMADVVARHETPLALGSDTPATVALTGGGAAGNVAAWLARAGAPAVLVGCVGDDALAAVALDGIADVAHVRRGGRTGTCVVLVGPDGQRTMLPDPGANLDLRAADLADALLARARALYVSGYTLLREPTRAAAAAMIARARAAGVPVAVDPASAAPLAADPGALAAAAPFDLLLPNADEAAVLGDARLAREVVVTHGADGARWSDGERTRSIAAVAAAARDTTGAGDAFAAGFLSAWPGPVEEALRRGAALAAEAVAGAGARPR